MTGDPSQDAVGQPRFGVVEVDRDGRIVDVDPGGARLLGYARPEELIDAVPWLLDLYADPSDVRRLRGRLPRAAEYDEARWLRKDGSSIWIRTRPGRRTEGSPHALPHPLRIEDVTERRRLEERLRHAQRMEAVGEFAGGVTRDFNNILATILGHVDLLARSLEGSGASDAVEELEGIRSAATRGTSMVEHLLGFSRRRWIQLRQTSTSDLVRSSERLVRHLLPGSIRLHLTLTGDVPVFADPSTVEQILIALATNSRDAMPDGGVLSIRTGRVRWREGLRLRSGWGEPGMYGWIEVGDDGVGMTEEVMQRILEPGATAFDGKVTHGEGLALVYGLMKQHRGFIDIWSEPGEGTRVRLFFRAAEEEQEGETGTEVGEPGTEEGDASSPARRGKGRVLLVDDDPNLRRVTARVLTQRGFHVVQVEDGRAALRTLSGELAFDVILADLVMPGMDGIELARRIRAGSDSPRIVLTSGYLLEDLIGAEAELPDGVTFLQKPWSASTLLSAVDQGVRRGRNPPAADGAEGG